MNQGIFKQVRGVSNQVLERLSPGQQRKGAKQALDEQQQLKRFFSMRESDFEDIRKRYGAEGLDQYMNAMRKLVSKGGADGLPR